eukprot:TRINITY_DN18801_c0_g1_i1.p1 TRINITY_DN18801_c0_g1~~TRINITY_DN18801_c0_g1_i1.p1  ORF type:complete len:453 (-),score=8.40 TRINITY_DN18801_c0_g1_i1:141-1499(-)
MRWWSLVVVLQWAVVSSAPYDCEALSIRTFKEWAMKQQPVIDWTAGPVHPNVTFKARLYRIWPIKTAGFGMELSFHAMWKDSRYEGWNNCAEPLEIPMGPGASFVPWIPLHQLINSNHVQLADSTIGTYASVLRLYKDGTFDYRKGLTTEVGCDFDFHIFPFDAHVCNFTIFFAPRIKNLVIKEPFPNFDGEQPKLLSTLKVMEVSGQAVVGNYQMQGASIIFKFERLARTFLVRQLVPIFILSLVSCLSLFIDCTRAAPARAALAMTALLSLVTMTFVISATMPDVPYLTVLHVYIFCNLAFCSFNILIFVVLHWLHHTVEKAINKQKSGAYHKHDLVADVVHSAETLIHRKGDSGKNDSTELSREMLTAEEREKANDTNNKDIEGGSTEVTVPLRMAWVFVVNLKPKTPKRIEAWVRKSVTAVFALFNFLFLLVGALVSQHAAEKLLAEH